ncbi:MAG TPA: helix-turn-helix domain-containing protein [Candidatus Anaerostipes avicola]|uniref:helix-turn-helix domain-containing protein n=1 Tax=Anaerostipes TaxID=207244 RepID=UPI001F9F04FF|nr:helix-turn-helix domain-containing protein [Candidatus Anaerostipes avicola]
MQNQYDCRKGFPDEIRTAEWKDGLYRTLILNYSAPCCSRFIKEYTRHLFTKILLDIKFRKSLSLLESTNISIADISGMVGFENMEHFNRLFKKRCHMTPGTYRKKGN